MMHFYVTHNSDMKATLRAGWNESLEEVLQLTQCQLKKKVQYLYTNRLVRGEA